LAGEVKGATVLVLDDLISSGGTLVRAARTCLDHGAAAIWAYAAHGLFMQGADQAMGDSSLDRIIVTDSIPPFRLSEGMREKIEIVSVAPLFARAMQQLHNNDSIVELTS
ncbi:MAG: phosphoribosyltransferase family protein, partial [Desulfovibrionales bacterium]